MGCHAIANTMCAIQYLRSCVKPFAAINRCSWKMDRESVAGSRRGSRILQETGNDTSVPRERGFPGNCNGVSSSTSFYPQGDVINREIDGCIDR